MKRTLSRIVLCIILFAALGCTNREFVISGDTMSDGTVTYVHLPDGWRYSGEYPIKIDTVRKGNRLFASDETETIVRERKSLFRDMDYAPWIRSDVVFPDPMDDENPVVLNDYSKEVYDVKLSKAAAMTFKRMYAACSTSDKNVITVVKDKKPIVASICHPNIDGLHYSCVYDLIFDASHLYLGEYRGTYGGFYAYMEIPPETELYAELADRLNAPQD